MSKLWRNFNWGMGLILSLLLAACQPDTAVSPPTPTPILVETTTAVPLTATTTPSPTSPPPTPTSTAAAPATATPIPTACLDDSLPAVEPPAGKLRIVYEMGGQKWEWREETDTAVLLPPEPTPKPEFDGILSADGRFLATLHQPDENRFELWISAADGSNPRQLVTVSPDELFSRYPNAVRLRLAFGWVAGTSLISYRFVPDFDELGGVPVQTIGIIDAESSDTWTVLPADVAWAYQFSKDGQQLIALTEEGIQIINTADGTTRFDIPLDVVVPFEQGITYLPGGERLIIYTAAGIALVNPDDGTFTEIPLDYAPVGAGHYSILPPQYWLENETQFYTLASSDDIWNDPDASFTVWLVDTAVPSATPLSTFTGFLLSAELSPDRRKVVFWTQKMDNSRKLYLADVNTGQLFLYDEGRLLDFIRWSPDSSQFLYKPAESTQPILGHICAGPRPLTGITVTLNGAIQWVDDQRLLVLEDATGDGRPLRLITLDGQSTLIATVSDDYPAFRFYFEE